MFRKITLLQSASISLHKKTEFSIQCTYFVIGITQPVIGVTFKQLQLHQ